MRRSRFEHHCSRTMVREFVGPLSGFLMSALLIACLLPGTTRAAEPAAGQGLEKITYPASDLQSAHDAVLAAVAPGATRDDIKRAEDWLCGLGMQSLDVEAPGGGYEFINGVGTQKWYFTYLRLTEGPNAKIHEPVECWGRVKHGSVWMPPGQRGRDYEPSMSAVSVSAEYRSLARTRFERAVIGAEGKPFSALRDIGPADEGLVHDYGQAQGSLSALGWMAVFGNDPDSLALARRLNDAVATAWPKGSQRYVEHTHTIYFELLNLGRFAISQGAFKAPPAGTAPSASAMPAPAPAPSPSPSPPPSPAPPAVNAAPPPSTSAPRLDRIATGSGEVSASDGRAKVAFELWGDKAADRISLINFDMQGKPYQIAILANSKDETQGSGRMTPCEDGVCTCTLSGDQQKGQIWASCINSAHKEHGALKVNLQINGTPQAQPPKTMASGAAQLVKRNGSNEVIVPDATFEILGDEQQARIVRLRESAGAEAMNIAVDERHDGGKEGTGYIVEPSHCANRGCPCKLSELESEVRGSCSSRDNPDQGLAFTLWLKGKPRDTAPAPAPAPAPAAPVAPAARPEQPTARSDVPVSARLRLQSDRIPISESDPTYTQQRLDIRPAIYLDVTLADGRKIGPHDYQQRFAANVIFDDVSGDPNDLIEVSYWDIDRQRRELGKFAAQLMPTGKGVGNALLKVSFRNAPGVTASVPVTVVGTPPGSVQPQRSPPPPPAAAAPIAPQQPKTPSLVRLGTATGAFGRAGNTQDANFEFWGQQQQQPMLIRILTGGGAYEIHRNDGAGALGDNWGRLTPCTGGTCSCNLMEEGRNYFMGRCTSANPDDEMSFNFSPN